MYNSEYSRLQTFILFPGWLAGQPVLPRPYASASAPLFKIEAPFEEAWVPAPKQLQQHAAIAPLLLVDNDAPTSHNELGEFCESMLLSMQIRLKVDAELSTFRHLPSASSNRFVARLSMGQNTTALFSAAASATPSGAWQASGAAPQTHSNGPQPADRRYVNSLDWSAPPSSLHMSPSQAASTAAGGAAAPPLLKVAAAMAAGAGGGGDGGVPPLPLTADCPPLVAAATPVHPPYPIHPFLPPHLQHLLPAAARHSNAAPRRSNSMNRAASGRGVKPRTGGPRVLQATELTHGPLGSLAGGTSTLPSSAEGPSVGNGAAASDLGSGPGGGQNTPAQLVSDERTGGTGGVVAGLWQEQDLAQLPLEPAVDVATGATYLSPIVTPPPRGGGGSAAAANGAATAERVAPYASAHPPSGASGGRILRPIPEADTASRLDLHKEGLGPAAAAAAAAAVVTRPPTSSTAAALLSPPWSLVDRSPSQGQVLILNPHHQQLLVQHDQQPAHQQAQQQHQAREQQPQPQPQRSGTQRKGTQRHPGGSSAAGSSNLTPSPRSASWYGGAPAVHPDPTRVVPEVPVEMRLCRVAAELLEGLSEIRPLSTEGLAPEQLDGNGAATPQQQPPPPPLRVAARAGGGSAAGNPNAVKAGWLPESSALAPPVAGVGGDGGGGGRWQGQPVAVKLVVGNQLEHRNGALLSVLGAATAVHSGLVRVYGIRLLPATSVGAVECRGLFKAAAATGEAVAAAVAALGLQPGEGVLVVIMELCVMGSLGPLTLAAYSPFRPNRCWPAYMARRALLCTALEVAGALAHLHRFGLTHGALRPNNVLLVPALQDKRKFCVKVADDLLFLAPEALTQSEPGRLMASQPADVFSFGILLWSLAAAQTSWPPELLLMDLQGGPGGGGGGGAGPAAAAVAATLQELYEACVSSAPEQRPSMDQVVSELRLLDEGLRNERPKGRAAAAAGYAALAAAGMSRGGASGCYMPGFLL
ncbi:hypothetical protein VOLCADRAFT_89429 [Volvox carteri f. nagariensis]|uniref:Protein kinase domain-containing protein n=1 Tax=Volvox carteri f. nagariensis TaxID=3068 RepID=D8TRP0_VOLCA|nr:uncharacterized protein VOLCADRAFT_89429 [Volvox carteri f. nagariensis]EFJ50024.1 hypothetical protein VOLCADRAFT_89429 [Volvox carteri f. nagariensis]|eukprot:XP_002949089.1 hypothetical protein VOLCADRAFT_89429 [Volvox carteri f. nagariensis]